MRLRQLIAGILTVISIASCGLVNKQTKRASQPKQLNPVYAKHFHAGVRYKLAGNYEEALTSFEAAIQIDPTQDAPHFALSEIYLEKGDRLKSAQHMEQAGKLDPSNLHYVQELAYLNYEKGEFKRSLSFFEQLLKDQPANIDFLYGYAECLVQLGKTADAIKALDKTEAQLGVFPEIATQKFNLYLKLKKDQLAIKEIEKARELFPTDPQLLGVLIDYYFQHDQDKAIDMLAELARVDPENGRAHMALSEIYRSQKRMDLFYSHLKLAIPCKDIGIDEKMKALIGLQEMNYKLTQREMDMALLLVKTYPNEAKSYSLLGDYYMQLGNEADALTNYRKALAFDKNLYPIWKQVLMLAYSTMQFETLYSDAKACVEVFPAMPLPYLLGGIGANQTKRFDAALELLEIGRDLATGDKAMQAEFLAQEGESYFAKKDYNKAQLNYEEALLFDSSSNLIKNNYAYRLALSKQKLDRAQQLIDEVLKSESKSAHFIDTKGLVLFQLGKYTEAFSCFERANSISNSDKIIIEHLGDVQFKLGDATKAVEYWKLAKTLGSTNLNLDKKIKDKVYYDAVY